MNLKLILIVVGLVNFYLPLGFAPLFDLDEGAFSEATREMLQSGNYITTYLDGALRFDKPILIYWLQALSVKTFGLNEFALRLPSAIAATLWALAIYIFSKHLFNKKIAFYSTLAMLASLQITLIAKAAIADALLNLFIASSLFAIWFFLEKREKKYLYAAFIAIALGTLTKGPVAILIPLVTTFLYLLTQKQLKLFFTMVFNPIGIVLFLAIAMPWYVLEYLDQGEKFIDGFIFKHNLARFETSFEHHRGTIFYYIPVLLLGLTPFTTTLIESLWRLKGSFGKSIFLYLFIWFAFVFLFFSLSGTKLPHYIVYGYTPLFIFIGYTLAQKKAPIGYTFLLPTLLVLLGLVLVPSILPFLEPKNAYYEALFQGALKLFNKEYQLIGIAVIIILLVLPKLRLSQELKAGIIALLFGLFINMQVITKYGNLTQLPIKQAALLAKKEGYRVILYHFTRPSFLVYSQQKSLHKRVEVGDIVLTQKNNLPKFKKYQVKYSQNGVYLIKVEK